MIKRLMLIMVSSLFLISCGGEKSVRYAEIKAGIVAHCSWLPTAASMTKLVNETVGVPIETVVRLVCAEVNKQAFNMEPRIIFVQDGEETICIDVDGRPVCIDGEKVDD